LDFQQPHFILFACLRGGRREGRKEGRKEGKNKGLITVEQERRAKKNNLF